MAGQRRVVFARINRRNVSQAALFERSFAADMALLADSRRTRFVQQRGTSELPRIWTAGDMAVTADNSFLTGILGYAEQHVRRTLDDETLSWLKGEEQAGFDAEERALVPFAIDLGESDRWVALSTPSGMQPSTPRFGLERVLQQAVADVGEIPGDWEVDLVTSKAAISEWIGRHPRVYKLSRTVKIDNPGLDLSEEIATMRAMAARTKREDYSAYYARELDVTSEEFGEKLEGTELGNLTVRMEARGEAQGSTATFNSAEQVDRVEVDDTGDDLEAGVDVVLQALRGYRGRRVDSTAPELPLGEANDDGAGSGSDEEPTEGPRQDDAH